MKDFLTEFITFSHAPAYTVIKYLIKGAFLLNNNMDINKLLSVLSKMDKAELEKNIYRAQQILNNSDIKKEFDKKD